MIYPTLRAPGLAVPFFFLVAPAPTLIAQASDEAAAVRTFKREFKPKAQAIELKKAVLGKKVDSSPYRAELDRRNRITSQWREAAKGLRGFGSPAVARLVVAGWTRVEKEIRPLWKVHAKLQKRAERDYAKVLKANGGKPVERKKRYPATVIQAYELWMIDCRHASEVRRDITELTSLHDELRIVVAEMKTAAGLIWMLENLLGKRQQALVLKVTAIRAAAALGETMLPTLTAALDKAKKPDVIAAVVLGIGMLGEKARASGPKLIALMQHEDVGVREMAALALQHMKVPESIEPLIILLARENGHARTRIAGALEILTGQQHGVRVSAWQAWFAKEGAEYAAGNKPLGLGQPSAPREYDKKNYYYGIPQDGKGIVYILDCSGSMIVDKDDPQWGNPSKDRDPLPARDKKNSRSEASKRELIRALGSLSSDKTFNIVWYNHSAKLFKKTMVAATPDNVKAAKEFVGGLPADSSTNIYEAMKLAFTLTCRGSFDKYYGVEFDTVFLLTDGKPTLQAVGDDDPIKIIEGVREWNALKRVVIHTIAMGDSGIDHEFMQKLADENGGEYRKLVKADEAGEKKK